MDKKRRNNRGRPLRSRFSLVQKVILGVIGVAILAVLVALLSMFMSDPERSIKSKIDTMASDYYENYLYKNLAESGIYINDKEGLKKTLAEYSETGLSSITLRQFLLYDNRKYGADAEFLTKYCNENKTYVKFFPEPPYEKNSYRAEFNYSCNFE